MSVLLNNGNGFALPVPYAAGGAALSLALADFNQDGNTDIAVACGTDFIYVLAGNADGTFQPATSIALPSAAMGVAAGDFNGDGIPDLAVAAGKVLILFGDGHGGFGSPIVTTVPELAGSLVTGDFNNDGKLDLAVDVQRPMGHKIYSPVTLLGNGDGTFQPAKTVGYYVSRVLLVADINGDGIADLIVPNAFLLGNGDGTFQPPVSYPTESDRADFTALADVNGDGKVDILSASTTGSVSISLGNTAEGQTWAQCTR